MSRPESETVAREPKHVPVRRYRIDKRDYTSSHSSPPYRETYTPNPDETSNHTKNEKRKRRNTYMNQPDHARPAPRFRATLFLLSTRAQSSPSKAPESFSQYRQKGSHSHNSYACRAQYSITASLSPLSDSGVELYTPSTSRCTQYLYVAISSGRSLPR